MAENYFAELGYDCPEFENLADFYIDLLTVNTTSQSNEEESKRRINDIIEQSETRQGQPEPFHSAGGPIDGGKERNGAGRLRQMYLIGKRSLMNTQRNPGYLVGRFVQSLVMGFSIALLWWQIDNDQTAIQDRFGVVFIALLGSAFPEAVTASLVCEFPCFSYFLTHSI